MNTSSVFQPSRIRRLPGILCLAVFLAAGGLPSPDGRAAISPTKTNPAAARPLDLDRSHWKASDTSGSEFWLVARADGLMVMRGRDAASTYEGLLLKGDAPDTFISHGTGFRFVGGLGFTYQSKLVLKKEGDKATLTEEWSATLSTGDTVRGTTVFSQANEPESR